MPRLHPQSFIVSDLAGAEQALARLCEIKRETDLIDAELNERIDQAKATAATSAAPLISERTVILTALESYAQLKKAELTAKSRSVDLAYGVIGFRRSKEVKPKGKRNFRVILEAIKALGLPGVRIKEELDKDELKTWPDERLDSVGARIVEKDTFFVELKEESVANQAA